MDLHSAAALRRSFLQHQIYDLSGGNYLRRAAVMQQVLSMVIPTALQYPSLHHVSKQFKHCIVMSM